MDYQAFWNDLEEVAKKYGYQLGTLNDSVDNSIVVMFEKLDSTNSPK